MCYFVQNIIADYRVEWIEAKYRMSVKALPWLSPCFEFFFLIIIIALIVSLLSEKEAKMQV